MLLFRQPCVQFSLQATRPLKEHPRNRYTVVKADLDDMMGACPEKWTGYISGEVPAAHLLWLQAFLVSGVSPPLVFDLAFP